MTPTTAGDRIGLSIKVTAMDRNYWSDVCTGKTWEEFLRHGAGVTGFRERGKNVAKRIRPGDYFICYLTGLSRFIGVLEVLSHSYYDKTPIWEDQPFPVRFDVKVIYKLDAKTAVPIHDLRDRLSMFRKLRTSTHWSGFFRRSPVQFDPEDAEIIIEAIKDAVANPIEREYDEKQYWTSPKLYGSPTGERVTVPEDDKSKADEDATESIQTTHDEMQWLLLKLGSDMGLDVWVARNDLGKKFNGIPFKTIPNLRRELPMQFDDATNRIIQLIDVLWLRKNTIVAAFEVEHTSSIYSGLLRMSDLISMQQNLNINLYIVAPDERSDKVIAEVNRPTFAMLHPPLPKICKFLPYSRLKNEVERIGKVAQYISPKFIDDLAESCEPSEV